MSEAAIVPVTEQQPVTYFAATNAEEMARAQGGLAVWVETRITQARMDRMELSRAVENARIHKWATSALQRQLSRAVKLEGYYLKMLEALKAGYVLVPAFPIDIFAIRTDRDRPLPNGRVAEDDQHSLANVTSEVLPPGEGDYKSNRASRVIRYSHDEKAKDYSGKEITKKHWWFTNADFQDVTFPMVACKPHVMSATAQAMGKKIFDEIGIVTEAGNQWNSASARRGDPLIIGAIYGPRIGYTRRRCHFLISWHVNLEDL